ncbi:MAG: efflux RND transporter periplasmic adaptor subunit [Candidatus Brocadiae bacterium]|nr:efflux RND transporter periplasmic adaptor subunit [Candidatus Brocadiia bacterium]
MARMMARLTAGLTGDHLKWVAALCALLVLTAAGIASGGGQDPPPVGGLIVVQARFAEFRRTVRVPGALQPEEKTRITSKLSGVPILKLLPEGTAVRAGDVIVELDTADIEENILTVKEDIVTAEANLTAAQIAFERAKAEIEEDTAELEAKLAVAQARFDLEQSRPLPGPLAVARAQLDRAKAGCQYAEYWLASTRELFEEGALSRKDVRAAELAHHSAVLDQQHAQRTLNEIAGGAQPEDLGSARAELTEARVSYEQAAQSKEDRVKTAEASVKSAENALDALRRRLSELEDDLENTQITAPHDGVVFAHAGRQLDIGYPTWPGLVLAELADTSSLVLHGRVREADSRLVVVDQPARVRLLAHPDRAVPGTVTKVAETLSEDEDSPGVRYLEVEVKLDEVPPGMRPRMNGYAEVEVESMSHALVIPRACILDGKVTALEGTKRRTRSVDVLASDGSMAAIGSGLADGQWVLLNPEE